MRQSRRARGRDEGGSRTLRRSAGGCTKRLGAAGTRGTMWKTASASPPSGGRPRLAADHTHKEPCTKTAGRGPVPFTHLTVELYVRKRSGSACAPGRLRRPRGPWAQRGAGSGRLRAHVSSVSRRLQRIGRHAHFDRDVGNRTHPLGRVNSFTRMTRKRAPMGGDRIPPNGGGRRRAGIVRVNPPHCARAHWWRSRRCASAYRARPTW